MACQGIDALTEYTLTTILAYPTSCDYYFYAKILGAIFIIVALILYETEKEKFVKPDAISCLGVSALAVIFLALLGTLVGIIQVDIFIETFVIGMIFIVIWMFKK